jgi:hypothetical protein
MVLVIALAVLLVCAAIVVIFAAAGYAARYWLQDVQPQVAAVATGVSSAAAGATADASAVRLRRRHGRRTHNDDVRFPPSTLAGDDSVQDGPTDEAADDTDCCHDQ